MASNTGFDCEGSSTRFLKAALNAGAGFQGSYYGGSPAKDLAKEWVAQAFSLGLPGMLSYFESRNNLISYFSTDQGKADAYQTYHQAQAVGQPTGTAIFPAIDLDASAALVQGAISQYWKAWNDELGGDYVIGVYGGGAACSFLMNEGYAKYSVLGAIGWRGGSAFLPKANIVQKPPTDIYHIGVEVDPLYAQTADCGLWNLQGPVTISMPLPIVVQNGTSGDVVRSVQAFLSVNVDGDCGPQTEAAIKAWQTRNSLYPNGNLTAADLKLMGIIYG